MKFRRNIILIILFVILLSGNIQAQMEDIPTLWMVIQNDTDGISLMHTSSGEIIPLLGADAVKTGAEINTQFSPSGEFVALQIIEINTNTQYPFAFDGMTINEAEAQNWLYVFNTTGDLVHRAPLLNDDFMLTQFYAGSDGFYLADTFIRGGLVMSWSPDGSRLVYGVGTSGSGNPDDFEPNGFGTLHVWQAETGDVVALEDTPGTATDIHWSPDSTNAVYRGVDNFGTGAGASGAGTYVIRADNRVSVLPLDTVAGAERFAVDDTVIHGWLEDNLVAFSDFAIEAGAAGLFVYDVDADTILSLLPTIQINLSHRATGIDPSTGTLYAFATYFITALELDFPDYAEQLIGNGLHIYDSIDSSPERIILPEDLPERDIRQIALVDAGKLLIRYRIDGEMIHLIYDIETGDLTEIGDLPWVGLRINGDGMATIYNDDDETNPTLTLVNLMTDTRFLLDVPNATSITWLDEMVFYVAEADTLYIGTRDVGLFSQIDVNGTVLAVSIDAS